MSVCDFCQLFIGAMCSMNSRIPGSLFMAISHASQMVAIWFRVFEEGDQVRHADKANLAADFVVVALFASTLLSEKHVRFEWAQLRSTISFNLELARKVID